MAMPHNQGAESITQAEHVSPSKTGDNIEAKRVVNYGFDGSEWSRMSPSGSLITKPFDTIQVTSYNSNNDPLVVVYRLGGASGTIQHTLTITYDASYNITEVVRT